MCFRIHARTNYLQEHCRTCLGSCICKQAAKLLVHSETELVNLSKHASSRMVPDMSLNCVDDLRVVLRLRGRAAIPWCILQVRQDLVFQAGVDTPQGRPSTLYALVDRFSSGKVSDASLKMATNAVNSAVAYLFPPALAAFVQRAVFSTIVFSTMVETFSKAPGRTPAFQIMMR